jgi:hypothetical protein
VVSSAALGRRGRERKSSVGESGEVGKTPGAAAEAVGTGGGGGLSFGGGGSREADAAFNSTGNHRGRDICWPTNALNNAMVQATRSSPRFLRTYYNRDLAKIFGSRLVTFPLAPRLLWNPLVPLVWTTSTLHYPHLSVISILKACAGSAKYEP